MDNYLSHRWPQGPGVQPPPVPRPQPPRPGKKPHRARRWIISITCVILCLSLLCGVSFWAVSAIADMLASAEPPSFPYDDPRPKASREVSRDPDWSPDELPWGDPDPAVQLSVQPAGGVLTGRGVYQKVLPSLVCVQVSLTELGRYSMGTGVIVTGSGYVLTNYHIIDEALSVQVGLLDGGNRYYDAQVIGFDEEFDLAVLKFDPDGVELTPADLGDSDQLSVGDWVYAVGNPMGYLLGSMSIGVVSALGRDEDESGNALGLIQTDAVLNPGNSGGALVNEAGQVVGITCAKITGLVRENGEAIDDAAVLEGMGLAIPISDALPFFNHILATGESWRPAMGIQCSAVEVDGRRGIRVAEVTGASAREAGLRAGDFIVSANGADVTTLLELRRVLYRTGAGGELRCTVLRGEEELEVAFALIDSLKENQ